MAKTVPTPEQLEKITRSIVRKVKAFKNYGRVKEVYVDGGGDTSYRYGSILHSRNLGFSWNEDHDFCERHYDAFGVIDSCPKFKEWEDFAKQVIKDVEKEYAVEVRLDLEGVKYEITLDVTVTLFPLPSKKALA